MLKTVKNGSGIRVAPPPCFFKIPTFSRFFLATSLKKSDTFPEKTLDQCTELMYIATLVSKRSSELLTECNVGMANVHFWWSPPVTRPLL